MITTNTFSMILGDSFKILTRLRISEDFAFEYLRLPRIGAKTSLCVLYMRQKAIVTIPSVAMFWSSPVITHHDVGGELKYPI